LDTVKNVKMRVYSKSASVLSDGCIYYIEGRLVVCTVSEADLIRRTVACVRLRVNNTCDSQVYNTD